MASKIVSTEALFTTLVIDAHEGQDIGFFYVLGEYLNEEMPGEKKILMKFRG